MQVPIDLNGHHHSNEPSSPTRITTTNHDVDVDVVPLTSTDSHDASTPLPLPLTSKLKTEAASTIVRNELEQELPVISADLIGLNEIVERLVAQIHADLLNLTETLPSSTDLNRKRSIVDYVLGTRRQLLKLLVLVRWSKYANDINKSMNIIGFLSRQNYEFDHSIESLTEVQSMLANARVRNYDLTSSISILQSSTPPSIPLSIPHSFHSRLPLTPSRIISTLSEINDLLNYRLATIETLPRAFKKYWIKDGRVGFTVQGVWQGDFTFGGAKGKEEWFLLRVKFGFRVKDVRGVWSSEPTGPIKETILDLCNRELSRHPKSPTPNVNSLIRAYIFLTKLSLSYQIESLANQVSTLIATRWNGHLRAVREDQGTGLRIDYWLPKESGSTASTTGTGSGTGRANSAIANTATVATPSLKFSFGRTKLASATNHGDVERRRKRALENLLVRGGARGRRKSNEHATTDGEREGGEEEEDDEEVDEALSISWNLTTDTTLTIDTSRITLSLNDELNLEKLLNTVTSYHARSTIEHLYEQLLNELDPNDLELVFPSEATRTAAEEEEQVPSIKVHLHASHYLLASISPLSGKLEFKALGEVSTMREARLRGAADKVDQARKTFGETLLRVRTSTILDEVDAKASYLGLTTSKRLPLRSADMTRFGTTTRGLFFIHVRALGQSSNSVGSSFGMRTGTHSNWYLAVVMNESGFRFALVSTREETDQMNSWTAIDEMGWLDRTKVSTFTATGFDVGIEDLRDLYTYCVQRVCFYLIESQLHARKIPYQHAASTSSSTLTTSAPYLVVHSNDLIRLPEPIAYRNVAIRLHQSSSTNESESNYVSFLIRLKPPLLDPPSSETELSNIDYDAKTGVLHFKFHRVESCVANFLSAYALIVKSIVMKKHRKIEEQKQNILLIKAATAAAKMKKMSDIEAANVTTTAKTAQ